MSIILDDLRGMAQSGVPLCDLAADEIESLEQAYELLFKENAKLRQQADQQAQPFGYIGADAYTLISGGEQVSSTFSPLKICDDDVPLFTSQPAQAEKDQRVIEAAVQELRNIADAKRFDKKCFDDDTTFADWAQSRARFTLAEFDKAKR